MNFKFASSNIYGQRGPAGPDGNLIGTVISYMGKIAPKDYLVCDGSVLNIEDYSDLAAFFETQFGTKNKFGGDGEATFAVPDIRGRFLLNADIIDNVTTIGGEANHVLTGSELPNHYHTYLLKQYYNDSVNHKHNDLSATAGFSMPIGTSGNAVFERYYQTDAVGQNRAHNNMPPYMTVLYCIKAVDPMNYSAIPTGMISMWSGSENDIPSG